LNSCLLPSNCPEELISPSLPILILFSRVSHFLLPEFLPPPDNFLRPELCFYLPFIFPSQFPTPFSSPSFRCFFALSDFLHFEGTLLPNIHVFLSAWRMLRFRGFFAHHFRPSSFFWYLPVSCLLHVTPFSFPPFVFFPGPLPSAFYSFLTPRFSPTFAVLAGISFVTHCNAATGSPFHFA